MANFKFRVRVGRLRATGFQVGADSLRKTTSTQAVELAGFFPGRSTVLPLHSPRPRASLTHTKARLSDSITHAIVCLIKFKLTVYSASVELPAAQWHADPFPATAHWQSLAVPVRKDNLQP